MQGMHLTILNQVFFQKLKAFDGALAEAFKLVVAEIWEFVFHGKSKLLAFCSFWTADVVATSKINVFREDFLLKK